MKNPTLRRSALYIPCLNTRAINKARTLPTDMLLFDLEDSIAPNSKDEARLKIVEELNEGGFGSREQVLRINGKQTPFWHDDLKVLKRCTPDGVLIPKINDGQDVETTTGAVLEHSRNKDLGIWLMIETPGSISNINDIGLQKERLDNLQGFVIGTNDLVKDSGLIPGENRKYLVPWLMTVVAAAKAYGLDVVDGVFNNISDPEGFIEEATSGREMGMSGKSLIHPNQINPANQVFSPSEEEIEEAQKIVDAFSTEESEGKGVIVVDGKMVERLHLEMARNVLMKAQFVKHL
ncbi:MAG: CoA ester lyase [Rhodobacteraceae bacterium]|nr:CoA ester lyase [Paracoccaceae bacterium]